MAYDSFENLEVWKRACRLAVKLCRLIGDCKDYAFKDQMSRAAISIASNIAEGAERGSKAEFVRFLNIAKGSAAELRTQIYAELRTQIYIAVKLGTIIPEKRSIELVSELKEISNMLHGLIKSQRT